jgi:hypothetical protein
MALFCGASQNHAGELIVVRFFKPGVPASANDLNHIAR